MDDPFPAGMMEEWRAFLSQERQLSDVFATQLLFPLQRQRENAAMLRLASRAEAVMEVGADKGGSVWLWCKALKSLRYMIACEVRGCPYKQLMEVAFPHISFMWVEESSLNVRAVSRVRSWVAHSQPLDALFIDGDKSHFDDDFDNYRSCVSDTSLVFMHDVCDEPMKSQYASVLRRGYQSSLIVDHSEVDELIAQPANPHEAWLHHWGKRSCTVGVVHMQKGVR